MSSVQPIDFPKMLDEIKSVREKYNMPKGFLFVPDKLEISVQRVSYDNFRLSYKEFFNYLPTHALDMVIPVSINFLVQAGIPRERIRQINENGIQMELEGNLLLIASVILAELLIQRRFEDDSETSSLFNAIEKLRKGFTDFSELEFEWNSEVEKRVYGFLENMFKLMQEHPSALAEMEAIVRKYMPSKTPQSDEAKKEPES